MLALLCYIIGMCSLGARWLIASGTGILAAISVAMENLMSPLIPAALQLREKGKLKNALVTWTMLLAGGALVWLNANGWVLLGLVLIVIAWVADIQMNIVDAAIDLTESASVNVAEAGYATREQLHEELEEVRRELQEQVLSNADRLACLED